MLDAAVLLSGARGELARLPSVLDSLLARLDAATWRERPAPAEWSPLEIVCHLRDEEAEDFGARVRVVVEGGDRFLPIDPVRWAEERRYHEPTRIQRCRRCVTVGRRASPIWPRSSLRGCTRACPTPRSARCRA